MATKRAVNPAASSGRGASSAPVPLGEVLQKLDVPEALFCAFLAESIQAVQVPVYKRQTPNIVTFKQLAHTRIDGVHTRLLKWLMEKELGAPMSSFHIRGFKYTLTDSAIVTSSDGESTLSTALKEIFKSPTAWESALKVLRALKKDLTADDKRVYAKGVAMHTLTYDDLCSLTAEDVLCKRSSIEQFLDINDDKTSRALKRFSKQQQLFWVRFPGQKIRDLTGGLPRKPESAGYLRRPGGGPTIDLSQPGVTTAVVRGENIAATSADSGPPNVVFQRGMQSGNGIITFVGAPGYRIQFSQQNEGLPEPTVGHIQTPATKENERDVITLTYSPAHGLLKATWYPRFLKFYNLSRANLEGVLAKAQGADPESPEGELEDFGIDLEADFPCDLPANLLSTFDTTKFPARVCPPTKAKDYTLTRKDKERLSERHGQVSWIDIPGTLSRNPDQWLLVDGKTDLAESPFPVILIPPRPAAVSKNGGAGRVELSEGELDFWSMFPNAPGSAGPAAVVGGTKRGARPASSGAGESAGAKRSKRV